MIFLAGFSADGDVEEPGFLFITGEVGVMSEVVSGDDLKFCGSLFHQTLEVIYPMEISSGFLPPLGGRGVAPQV